jgi:hypothetical protein
MVMFIGGRMRFILITIALMGASALADYTPVEVGLINQKTFPAENLNDLKPNTIKYSWRFEDFTTWSGQEKKMLNLFETFKPNSENPLVVFIAKDTALLDKSADSVDLRPFVTLNQIKTVDTKNTAIAPNDVVTYKYQKSFYRNPPPPARWCDGSSTNTMCLQTLIVLPPNEGAELRDQWKKAEYKDLIGQSEFRIYQGDEIKNVADLQQLTKITETKPTAVMVENSFWFSHILGFGKSVAIFQPLPSDPKNKTLVTAFFVFGIEKKYWEIQKGESLGKPQTGAMYIQGKSIANSNMGLGKGVPKYTMELFGNALKVLSR